jgi:hypothetical protein
MNGYRGFAIDRFGDHPTYESGISEETLNDRINLLKSEFTTGAKSMFDKVEGNLKVHLARTDALVNNIGVSKNFISVGNKRIVTVAKGVDRKDAVVKEQLDGLEDKLKPAFRLSNILHPEKSTVVGEKNSLIVRDNRRIGGVSRGVQPYDVIVKSQLDELDVRVKNLENNYNSRP